MTQWIQAVPGWTLRIDVGKLIYIGNPDADNNTFVTWYTSGVKSIDAAKEKQIPVGAVGGPSGGTSSQFPRAMNALLGTKFKIIYGYAGGNDINLAMESGEVSGFGSDTWSAWKATHPDWIKDKKINIIVQIGLRKAPDLPNVPLLIDLAKTDEDRTILKLLSTPSVIGRPIFTTPAVPADRVAALRQAFDETLRDPAFLKDAATADAALSPVSGERLQQLVADIETAPRPIVDRLARILENGEHAGR